MSDDLRYKACFFKSPSGEQVNVDEPIEIVMSDRSLDSDREIVHGFSNLKEFLRDNPLLRYMHMPGTAIGQVVSAVTKTSLPLKPVVGRFLLGEDGTSALVDEVRSKVRQRIIRAGSAGFRVGRREPIDPRDLSKGFNLFDNKIFEFSLVELGANANALMTGKAFEKLDSAEREAVLEIMGSSKTYVDLGGKTTSRVSDSDLPLTSKRSHSKMNAREQLAQIGSELEEARDRLKSLAEEEVADDDQDSHQLAIDELVDTVESLEKSYASKKRVVDAIDRGKKVKAAETVATQKSAAEKVMSGDEDAGGSDPDPEYTKAMTEHSGYVASAKEQDKGEMALKTIAFMLKSHATRTYPQHLLENERFKGREKAELEVMLKAATAPADTVTPAWAGNLVQERWDNFVGLLRDISVYAALNPAYVRALSFDRTGKINVPKNDGRGTLAGGFVAEGAPIPVKEGVIGITDLQPKELAVISTYTNKLFRQSIPNIEQVIRDQILGDTAESLDAHLLGSAARTAIEPAGYQDPAETGAGNIVSATGSTVAAITQDLQKMVDRALTARISTSWTWILSQSNLLYLRNKQDAASGVFSFREELNNNMLMGLPWITSQNVQNDAVFLQGNGAVWQASAYAPEFEMSDSVVVFDDSNPEDIVSGGTATTQPTKSMFQTASTALRMMWGLDYRIVRPGGVQVLDTVNWAV